MTTSPDGTNHVHTFGERAREAASIERRRIPLMSGLAAGLLLLLVALKSPGVVWAYVSLLYVVAACGFGRVSEALKATQAALQHLQNVAEFLKGPPRRSRQELKNHISSLIDPNDNSNVPEAIWSLSDGHRNGESVRVAANGAFAQSQTQLSFAHFLRTALVLGGLFGTVLFFAFQLGGKEILAGDLAVLIPGLKGALAATLSGIGGSIALGYITSELDRVIESATWEAEAFLIGPVWNAIDEGAPVPVENEVELWTALRHEVADLKEGTTEAYGKLASETAVYSQSLLTISKQLTELPPVKVPEQLANLELVVTRFATGMASLEKASDTLVHAVGTLGVFAPAQMLQQLETIRSNIAAGQTQTLGSLAKVQEVAQDASSRAREAAAVSREVLDGAQKAVQEMGQRLGGISTGIDQMGAFASSASTEIRSTIEGLAQSTHSLRHEVSEIRAGVLRIQEAPKVAAAVALQSELPAKPLPIVNADPTPPVSNALALVASARDSDGSASDVRPSLTYERLLEALRDAHGELQAVSPAIQASASQLAGQERVLSEANSQLQSLVRQSDSVQDQVRLAREDITGLRDSVGRVATAMSRLDGVHEWHARAAAAPLMRVLLLPFRRSRASVHGNGA